jgi:hypothetical protein
MAVSPANFFSAPTCDEFFAKDTKQFQLIAESFAELKTLRDYNLQENLFV